MRILTLNPRGCAITDVSKINMLTEATKRHQNDVVSLNETSGKLNTNNAGRMEKMLKKISREAKVTTTDSKEWNMAPKDYFPGGLMSAFFGNYSSLMKDEKPKIGKLRNRIVAKLEHNDKK